MSKAICIIIFINREIISRISIDHLANILSSYCRDLNLSVNNLC